MNTEELKQEKERQNKVLHLILEKRPQCKEFHRALTNLIESAIDYDLAFTVLQSDLDVRTDFVPDTDTASLQRKISLIRFLDGLIHISGVVTYRDEILTSYIASMFTKQNVDMESLLKEIQRYTK